MHIDLLFSWRYNPLWLYFHSPVAGFSFLVFEVSWSHTTTRHSRQDSSGRVISSSQRPLPDNTQHSQQTNIHAPPGGIRTHNLSRRAAEDLRLRPRDHWDRHSFIVITNKCTVNIIKVHVTAVHNLYCYVFRHFRVIMGGSLHLRLAKPHKFTKLQLLKIKFHKI